jgi:hypothetical protein
VRDSVGLHTFLRRTTLRCTNDVCGWTGKGFHEITHELSPSGMANPTVTLPIADYALRREIMASAMDLDQGDMFDAMCG